MFAGVSNEAIIAIGGANFPGASPWEGGKKKWYDDIFVLEKGKKGWVRSAHNFPGTCGYGVSITYKNQLIVIGGSNANEHLTQVMGVVWNGTDVVLTNYPSLPYPLAQMGGLLIEDMIVLVGGSQSATSVSIRTCLILDLKNLKAGWQQNDTFRALPEFSRFVVFTMEMVTCLVGKHRGSMPKAISIGIFCWMPTTFS
ncbi:hypothetical protein GO730_16345 [Spirosoma sp. HMF3257]|uniref:Galactose oxidase n=1 Tax=Spirosoma telluris TaxID=2183553 RepID=A0A327NJI7_9BACT|nr:hypothetical protein [Spirosoma telluris]RAI75347.1 hypothetical protein HMF3257_16280 [Spirosoma telluris]